MKVTQNCIINGMPEDVYHGDPCPEPSLSSTMANTIIEKTEIEAKLQSKRLNPTVEEKTSDAMDLGTLAHDYILSGGLAKFEVAPFDAWRSKDAKAAKAAIESRGLIALNENTASIVDDVKNMRDRLFDQLSEHKNYSNILRKFKPEQSAFSYDEKMKLWSRARFDALEESAPIIVDYKTTALPFDRWEKGELWGGGKYMQNPHYRHVLDTINGQNAPKSEFIWVVQCTVEPFLVKIFVIDESYMEQVEQRYMSARLRFQNCLRTGLWRGELPYTIHTFPPPWIVNKWDNDDLNRVIVAEEEKAQKDIVNTMAAG